MSTHANITVRKKDGSDYTIYCHFDGDILLPILQQEFDTQEKAEWLIDRGDISYLGKYGKMVKWEEGENPFPDEETMDREYTKFYCNRTGENWEHIQPRKGKINEESYHYYWDGESWI